jgi:hypothetical protein
MTTKIGNSSNSIRRTSGVSTGRELTPEEDGEDGDLDQASLAAPFRAFGVCDTLRVVALRSAHTRVSSPYTSLLLTHPPPLLYLHPPTPGPRCTPISNTPFSAHQTAAMARRDTYSNPNASDVLTFFLRTNQAIA